MNESTDPRRTIAVLTALRSRGFRDAEFSRLHHFADDTITIDQHIAYCEKDIAVSARWQ